MPFARKVLWVVNLNSAKAEAAFAGNAARVGANIVCIRSTSTRLPDAIDRFHQRGIKVYAWRWPAVVPGAHGAAHYYAMDEAAFVADRLVPAGLDGYIADPESDKPGSANDWNQAGLATLARDFCAAIRDAAPEGFVFGTTSGCAYPRPGNRPDIPWAEFVAASDVLLPQTYWRNAGGGINGGTPAKAIKRGLDAWRPIAAGKPIVPMAGEIAEASAASLAAYGAELVALGIDEAHFYTDTGAVPEANLDAIAAL